jgi:hypothetical protein
MVQCTLEESGLKHVEQRAGIPGALRTSVEYSKMLTLIHEFPLIYANHSCRLAQISGCSTDVLTDSITPYDRRSCAIAPKDDQAEKKGIMKYIFLLLLLTLTNATSPTPPPPAPTAVPAASDDHTVYLPFMTTSKIFARPLLANPQIYELRNSSSADQYNIDIYGRPDQDLRIIVREKITKSVKIGTWRNVEIIGGEFTIAKPMLPTDPNTPEVQRLHRAIGIGDIHGTAYLEGVWINNSGGGMHEGIQFFSAATPDSRLLIRNSRIEGVRNKPGDIGPDGIPTWHPDLLMHLSGNLELDNVTLTSSEYQGMFIGWRENGAPITSVHMRNVDVSNIVTQGFLMLTTQATEASFRQCSNCWYNPVGSTFPRSAAYGFLPQPNVVTSSFVAWTNAPQIGPGFAVWRGSPPQGNFVPANRVGMNYGQDRGWGTEDE